MFNSDVKTILKPAFAVFATTKLQIKIENAKRESNARESTSMSLFCPLCTIDFTFFIMSSMLILRSQDARTTVVKPLLGLVQR